MSELSGSLLQVVTSPSQGSSTGVPLWMEFPVAAVLAPFLVSRASSKGKVLWIGRAHNGKVKAALRDDTDLGAFFRAVVEAVANKGRELEWGNVHPPSREGLQAAIDHVRSYDLKKLEILANPETDWGSIHPDWEVEEGQIPMALLGLPLQPAVWMPLDTVVVVPRDREFVGFVYLHQKHLASVVHNSSRGMGIITSRPLPGKVPQKTL